LRALHEAGLPPNAVRFTWLTPGDTRAAFASRTIDAWACWTPYTTTAIAEGARVVADGQKLIAGYVFEVANEQAIATKRAILTDFLQRESKALDWAAAHPADYAEVLAKETGLPLDIALVMVRKNSRHSVPISPVIINDQKIILATFERAGEIKPVRNLDQAFAIL
jgi:sulfonate transport system substrate-binding protein